MERPGPESLNGIKRQLYLSFLIRRNARKQVKMQTCRGNWSAAPNLSRLVRDPRVFFHPVELSIQALGPLSNRFQRARVCLAARTPGGSIIHPSAPPYPFLFFRLLFLPDAEETAKDPSFDVPSLVSPSSSLFPLAVEVTQDQPAETCSLPSFLSLSASPFPLLLPSYSLDSSALPSTQSSKRQSNHSCCSLDEKYFHSNLLNEKILYRT